MALYVDLYRLIDDPDMTIRVKYAMFVLARNAFQNPNATAQQKTFAQKVFQDGLELPFRYIMTLVVSSPQVAAAGALVDDTTLQQVVNSIAPFLVQGIVT